jgi:transglutaminase-like putative cysteine protease
MPQFQIVHEFCYRFGRPVYLEPHTLRLQPRVDGSQFLSAFDLSVDPKPDGRSAALDAEGNVTSVVWFSGLHSKLAITARSTVSVCRSNPFEFLLDPRRATLPMAYPADEEMLLAVARKRQRDASGRDNIHDFAAKVCEGANGQAVAFLWGLTCLLHRDWSVIRREEGAAWPAAETFSRRMGACRDLAVLFIDACRCVGLAARFVSGYQQGSGTAIDLHAWPEVYLSGVGWQGYDPTQGLAVGENHVSVTAACGTENAAPVIGSFRGPSDVTTLDARISFSPVDAAFQTDVPSLSQFQMQRA